MLIIFNHTQLVELIIFVVGISFLLLGSETKIHILLKNIKKKKKFSLISRIKSLIIASAIASV